jgi:hypothetical protein
MQHTFLITVQNFSTQSSTWATETPSERQNLIQTHHLHEPEMNGAIVVIERGNKAPLKPLEYMDRTVK